MSSPGEKDTLRNPKVLEGNPLDNQIFLEDTVEAYGRVRQVNLSVDPKLQGTTYALNLKIFFETVPGESLCVLGSIPELGSWKKIMCHLKWTDGHIWVTEEPIMTSQPYFTYKYMMLDDEKATMVKWEAGIDRIVDLRLLPEFKREETHLNTRIVEMNPLDGGIGSQGQVTQDTISIKHVELIDEWEVFKVRFSMFYPIDSTDEEMNLEVNEVTLKMEKVNIDTNWMLNKYGQKMRPYWAEIKLPNTESGDSGQFGKLS